MSSRDRPPGALARAKRAPRPNLPPAVLEELRQTARRGEAEEAVTHMDRAVKSLAREEHVRAAKAAEEAKAAAPRSAAVREVLGLAYYQQGRFHEALSEMQAYRRLSGRQDQNHIAADCHRALGQPRKAVPLVEEELRAQVGEEAHAEAVVVGASALADMGRFEQALALLRRRSTRADVGRGSDLRIWYVTGDVLERAGRPDEAAEQFRRVVRHDPGAYDAAERLARLS